MCQRSLSLSVSLCLCLLLSPCFLFSLCVPCLHSLYVSCSLFLLVCLSRVKIHLYCYENVYCAKAEKLKYIIYISSLFLTHSHTHTHTHAHTLTCPLSLLSSVKTECVPGMGIKSLDCAAAGKVSGCKQKHLANQHAGHMQP